MKKIFCVMLLALAYYTSNAQVSYYEGEWTVKNKSDLFTCICKLEINGSVATAAFAWTFIAIDTMDSEINEFYKNKKGFSGIEYTEGTYDQATGDIDLVAVKLDDPNVIIGMTKYLLKFSADKNVIYGTTTDLENENPGIIYAIALKKSKGAKKMESVIHALKK